MSFRRSSYFAKGEGPKLQKASLSGLPLPFCSMLLVVGCYFSNNRSAVEMIWILYLLCLFGALGSVDIIYFHLYRYRLFKSPSSRGEQWTHLLRLAVFPAILFWVLFVRTSGWAAGILPGLLM